MNVIYVILIISIQCYCSNMTVSPWTFLAISVHSIDRSYQPTMYIMMWSSIEAVYPFCLQGILCIMATTYLLPLLLLLSWPFILWMLLLLVISQIGIIKTNNIPDFITLLAPTIVTIIATTVNYIISTSTILWLLLELLLTVAVSL